MKQSIIDILENCSANVNNNKEYYDKITDNWNKTITNRKKAIENTIKENEDNRFRDILDFI